MPFCAECEYEYEAGTTCCPECGAPLVDALPDQARYMCDECKTALPEDATGCAQCGTVFVDGLRCFHHPAAPAHGRCVVCGQHLCPRCAVRDAGRYFCETDAGESGDARDAAPETDWGAEKLRRFLERASVPSRVMTGRDTRRLRFHGDAGTMKLIAPRAYRRQVELVFIDRGVEGMAVLFECERCSAISGYDEPACPNCGKDDTP